LRSPDEIVPIGDNVKDIIESLSQDQLEQVVAVYHANMVKIAYEESLDLDREIWLRLLQREGSIRKIWTGPHTMKSFKEEATILSFDSQKNVRISWTDDEFFQRDDPGSYLNDGANIDRRIQISNLGLQFDHFWKLITWVFMSLKVAQEETFLLSFESEDGSDAMVVEVVVTPGNNPRLLSQTQLSRRWVARVMKLTIENSSNSLLSIYDLSILFQQQRRRRLGL
jgi:hypothetical protein